MNKPKIYICSDSIGETAERVVQATMKQFNSIDMETKKIGHIKSEEEITAIMEEAAETGGFIAYTLVQPELRQMVKDESIRLGVRAVDIMGPMIQAFVDTFHGSPNRTPGLLHQLDEEYFHRVEAIEFAVKSDDGRDTSAFTKANLVLIGISRTSKTPLSIFLAYKGIKVANFPLVPEVKLPDELLQIPARRIIGLTMQADKLLKIRTERLKTAGLPSSAKYASLERVIQEQEYADHWFRKIGCSTVDVTDKSIEETAEIIMGFHH
ncbi:MAG: phosphoenolpyruvate synthase regulatory protein [Paenibacillus sp. RIFOXYA1_FULL_44_5]|nr:MAG: phosphoenolpyruvate synthase regulatory protein [Paenibacillus sp. RIFOXYA1_FULL_44_5]